MLWESFRTNHFATRKKGEILMLILLKILILAFAIFLIAEIMPSVHLKSFGTAILVAIVYSVINFFTGWLLILLALPLMILTFGLFKFVINAILLWITDQLIGDFKIDTFGATLVAAFLITIVDALLRWMVFRGAI